MRVFRAQVSLKIRVDLINVFSTEQSIRLILKNMAYREHVRVIVKNTNCTPLEKARKR